MIASGFSWYHLIPGVKEWHFGHFHEGGPILLAATVIAGLIVALSFIARAQLQKAMAKPGLEKFEAEEGFTVRNLAEGVVGMWRNLMLEQMPANEMKNFLPLVVAIFAYILFNNMSGLVPGFLPATDNINTNIGMAIVVMLTYWWVGLSRDAGGFIKHMMGPMLPVALIIFPVEFLSLAVIRPGSLAIRLTANMYGDHQVFGILSELTYVVVPAAILALGLLVSFIQAFVFALLTTIYISLSLPHGDEHH